MATIKIQIAPRADQITITENSIHTNWNGGITYKAEGLSKYKDDYLKETFSTAIFLVSKRWQLEELLNNHLNLKGTIL